MNIEVNKTMGNKEWYEEDLWALRYLQELMDLYCFESKSFTVPEDITPDNFKEFLEIILTQYHYYNMHIGHVLDLGDAFDVYFRGEDCDYPETDRRALAFYISDMAIQSGVNWPILPEDVPFMLECLNAPDEQIIYMYDKLDNYFEQFDHCTRCNEEGPRRDKIINKQRLDAIAQKEPLPIRPMGIKLDMCYKK